MSEVEDRQNIFVVPKPVPRCPECGTPFEMSSKAEAVSSRPESSQQDTTP